MNEKVVEIEKPLKGKIKEEQEVSAKEDPFLPFSQKKRKIQTKLRKWKGSERMERLKKKSMNSFCG